MRGGFFSFHLFILPKCLIMQLFLVFSIVQLVHNSLHTTLALFCELYVWQRFTPGSHIYSVCSVYAVYVRYISSAEAAQTQCASTQESATDGFIPQTQHLSIILISNPNIVTENAFSA